MIIHLIPRDIKNENNYYFNHYTCNTLVLKEREKKKIVSWISDHKNIIIRTKT